MTWIIEWNTWEELDRALEDGALTLAKDDNNVLYLEKPTDEHLSQVALEFNPTHSR